MVFKGSEADFSGNTISGEGVAGIRTEGVVRATDNKFICTNQRKGGGPPQYAVWGLPGSKIVFNANKVDGWRHALVAEKASVKASENEVTRYWQVGMKFTDPNKNTIVIDNFFYSEELQKGIVVFGGKILEENNQVLKPTAKD